MAGTIKETKKTDLLRAIKNSVEDARFTIQTLAQMFKENIQPLRLEESENVFTNLSQNIYGLQHFLGYIKELKQGMSCFDNFGLPSDPISLQDSGFKLFKEMNSAFETKDWIMLSDLIEYELSPLLLKEDEWLGDLGERLVEYDV